MGRRKTMTKGVSNQLEKKLKGSVPTYDPNHKRFDWDAQRILASHWYDSFLSAKDEKSIAMVHMKLDKKYDVKKMNLLPDEDFIFFGRYFEMLANNFGEYDGEWISERLEEKYTKLLEKASRIKIVKNIKKTSAPSNRKSPQEYLMEKTLDKVSELLCLIDGFIENVDSIKKSDDLKYFDAVSWAHQNELGAKHIKIILDELTPERQPFVDALDGDTELRSGYLFTDSQLKRIVRFYDHTISELSSLMAQKKVARKPRKRKPKSPVQLVKSVKYLKSTEEFGGLKSSLPSKMIGSDMIVLLNVKYRRVSVYRAAGADGMSVKGTTLIGFDPSTSFEKRIREQYLDELLAVVKSKGIRAIKKHMDGINAKETAPTGRINADTLIIRIK